MIIRFFLLLNILLTSLTGSSQENPLLVSLLVSPELSANANAIIRWDDVHIEIKSYNKMVYTNKRIVTILNSSADAKHGAVMYYNGNIAIKKLEAKIYNSIGQEIKKFKKSDFDDVSAVSGGTLYSDDRVKYMNYTPISYPYTVLFETEVEFSSTAFINSWHPIEGYNTSTQNSDYKISNTSGISVKLKTTNFDTYNIEKMGDYHYAARNLKAITPEAYSPGFFNFAPELKASLTEFDMEGIKGINNNWSDFGKWMNDKLIEGTEVLPASVKQEIIALTADAETDLDKAKIVYQYMQDKTRYISVQIGIGGWKPMSAIDVDRLGYSDCKGLSNYTKALLNAAGVESYYAIIYGDRDIRNIDSTFSSVQGNHAVLCIKDDANYVWLECTNQTAPFGYNANFTDDRDALIITPEGGKIVHTTIYKTEDNLLDTKASVILNDAGDLSATIVSKSSGTQFGYHSAVQNRTVKDQRSNYKDYWSYINGLDIVNMEYQNDKDLIVFTEKIEVNATRYASKTGDRLLLQPNFFNRRATVPQRYQQRNSPFEIDRGYTDIDSYEIIIPENFEVEALIQDIAIKNQFGEYTVSMLQNQPNTLIYNRKFVINKGDYTKEAYEFFRAFILEVVKNDKAKIVLKSKS